MAVIYKRRFNLGRLFLIIMLIALILNIQDIGRYFYPLPHRELIEKYAAKHDIDPLLLTAIIKSESDFDPRARSKKGARGLMQIMPETGTWIAGQIGMKSFHPEKLYDVETNIRLGAWYFASLLREFDGELLPALAAYNGGRGNVRKWLTEKKRDEKELTASQIPFPETRKYVQNVLRAYKIYRYLYTDQRSPFDLLAINFHRRTDAQL